jgi:hypothetical protein
MAHVSFKALWEVSHAHRLWSPHSPHVIPCDFYLWGSVTDEVYKTNPHTLEELRTTSTARCQQFPENSRELTMCSTGIKSKVNTTTCHKGTEGEMRYSSTLSLTLALDGGWWLMPCPCRFTPRHDSLPIVQEAGWAPGMDWWGNSRPHLDSIPDSPVYSKSLYWLRYPGPRSAGILSTFGQESKFFSIWCSTGEFFLHFLKVIIPAILHVSPLTVTPPYMRHTIWRCKSIRPPLIGQARNGPPCIFCVKAHEGKECFQAQGMRLLHKQKKLSEKNAASLVWDFIIKRRIENQNWLFCVERSKLLSCVLLEM